MLGSRMLVKSLLKKLPLQKKIIFESVPDFSCNAYPVYLKFKEKHPEYKLIWAVGNRQIAACHHPDGIMDLYPKTLFQRIKAAYHLHTCAGIVSCNRVIPKRRDGQVSVYLGHGSKTKHTKGYYEPGLQADYLQVQSHFFDNVILEEYGCTRDQLVYLGYPRCDCFFSEESTAKNIDNEIKGRYIIWLPTIRKRISGKTDVQTSKYNEIGMPLVYSIEELKRLNDFLQEHRIHILYKPHPVQDNSTLRACTLSNIKILTDADLAEQGMQLYSVIAGSSALITDYSSVFFDYLLLDRPIATTTDDIESWKEGVGFAFDLEKLYDQATSRLSSLEELKDFILSVVVRGEDTLSAERKRICGLTNLYRDGNSAERVVNFLIEKCGQDLSEKVVMKNKGDPK